MEKCCECGNTAFSDGNYYCCECGYPLHDGCGFKVESQQNRVYIPFHLCQFCVKELATLNGWENKDFELLHKKWRFVD